LGGQIKLQLSRIWVNMVFEKKCENNLLNLRHYKVDFDLL